MIPHDLVEQAPFLLAVLAAILLCTYLPIVQRVSWKALKNLGSDKRFKASYVIMVGVPLAVAACGYFRVPPESFPPAFTYVLTAGLLVLLNILLFQLSCPSPIKNQSSAVEYIKEHKQVYMDSASHKKINIVLKGLDGPIDRPERERIRELG
jgi:hypothetical protein